MSGEQTFRIDSPATAATGSVPDMAVVLVYYNDEAYIGPCLESLYQGRLRSSFEVVLVDNGSTDDARTLLPDKLPHLSFMRNEVNVGLTRACNQGIEASRGRHVLLLNNDTLVDGESLDAMVDFLDAHPRAAAVGGRLLNPDGTVQSCYNHFPTLREEFLIASRLGSMWREGYPGVTDDNQVRSVAWLGSACLLVRRAALDDVGLLDESFFVYGAETDLQYRLREAGWEIYYLPHASTVHFGGGSMNRWGRRKMVYESKILFFQKHYGAVRTAALRAMLGGLTTLKLVCWGAISFPSKWRDRARKEFRSNLEVLRLCLDRD